MNLGSRISERYLLMLFLNRMLKDKEALVVLKNSFVIII
tara:strand:+ start:2324 stop:2440 length:117 start_codon:yes stop_codon:yes gene_type:complete